jgi:hypothetical protein
MSIQDRITLINLLLDHFKRDAKLLKHEMLDAHDQYGDAESYRHHVACAEFVCFRMDNWVECRGYIQSLRQIKRELQ